MGGGGDRFMDDGSFNNLTNQHTPNQTHLPRRTADHTIRPDNSRVRTSPPPPLCDEETHGGGGPVLPLPLDHKYSRHVFPHPPIHQHRTPGNHPNHRHPADVPRFLPATSRHHLRDFNRIEGRKRAEEYLYTRPNLARVRFGRGEEAGDQ